ANCPAELKCDCGDNLLPNGGFEYNDGSFAFDIPFETNPSDELQNGNAYNNRIYNWTPGLTGQYMFYIDDRTQQVNNPDGDYFVWLPGIDDCWVSNVDLSANLSFEDGERYQLCFYAAAWNVSLNGSGFPDGGTVNQSSTEVRLEMTFDRDGFTEIARWPVPASNSWGQLNWQQYTFDFVYDGTNPISNLLLTNGTNVGLAIDAVAITKVVCEPREICIGDDTDNDQDGLTDCLDPDCDGSGNAQSLVLTKGVRNAPAALYKPDGNAASLHDISDRLILDLGTILPTGTKYNLVWKRKSSYDDSNSADVIVQESADATQFAANPLEPSTTSKSQFVTTQLTTQRPTRFLRLRQKTESGDDFDLDAVTFEIDCGTEEICDNNIDDDGDGLVDCDDPDAWDCCGFDEWSYDCGAGTCIEIVGVGIKNNLNQTLSFSDPSTIKRIVIESTFDGGSGHPNQVTFTNAQGVAHTVDKIGFDTGSDYYFRAYFNPTSAITLSAPANTNQGRAETFIAYIFRECENVASAGAFTHKFLYRNAHTFTFDIPNSLGLRDIEIIVPLSEITNDGRIAKITATAGDVSKTITIDNYNSGNSLNLTPFVLEDVPGNVETVEIKVESPTSNGQSLYLSGAGAVNVICPQLDVELTANKSCASIGETIEYTYTINNAGNATVEQLQLSDTKVGTINIADRIGVGESINITQTYTVTSSDLPGPIQNTASLTGRVQGTNTTVNVSDDTDVAILDVSFDKSADVTTAKTGDVVTYAYTLTNNGSEAINFVIEDDKIGTIQQENSNSNETNSSTVIPGQTKTVTATHRITGDDLPSPLVNIATATVTTASGCTTTLTAQESIEVCLGNMDFTINAAGEPLKSGDYLATAYAEWGVNITTDNPTDHPAMVFNSSIPTGGDADLGTPNRDFGGPGEGAGGRAGQIGENSTSRGNVLIISEDNNPNDPDDNASGGTVTFTYDTPADIAFIEFIDADYGETQGRVRTYDAANNLLSETPIIAYGDNSFYYIIVDQTGVSKMEVYFPRSGSIVASYQCEPLPPHQSIGDLVWIDNDGDGQKDPDEEGLADVTVQLMDSAGNLLAETTTDRDGNYLFHNLMPATYQVVVVPTSLPDLYRPTYDLDGDLDGNSGDIVLNDSDRLDADFGYRIICEIPTGALIADDPIVCLPPRGDGQITVVPDGNAVVPDGFTTTYVLTRGDNQVIQQINDSPSFTVNTAGQYTVHTLIYQNTPGTSQYLNLSNILLGTTPLSTLDAQLRQGGGTVCAALDLTGASVEVDPCDARLGDYVWEDANANGLQDPNEIGIPNVSVQLTGSTADGEPISEVTMTDDSGQYLFDNLPSGTYEITFITPSDYSPTYVNESNDDTLDSDLDPNTGKIGNILLETSENNTTLDAGYYQTNNSIGDYVWED
ncbi:MAG: SdrD B-like domain-containing protein, partial [Bacteroidota bacterium]